MMRTRPYRAGFDKCAGSVKPSIMNLMLTAIFLCVAIGLGARSYGGRQQWAIAFIATLMTALYFVFSARFM
jgi:hypothetical protein